MNGLSIQNASLLTPLATIVFFVFLNTRTWMRATVGNLFFMIQRFYLVQFTTSVGVTSIKNLGKIICYEGIWRQLIAGAVMLCNQASRKWKLTESSGNKPRAKQTTWKQRSLPHDLADVWIAVTPIQNQDNHEKQLEFFSRTHSNSVSVNLSHK